MTLTRVNSNGITEIDKTKISGTAITAADTGTVTSAMIADGQVTSAKIADATIVNQDVSLTAAIEGTKISPNFGSQATATTGTSTAASFIPTGSSVPANGVYLPGANALGLATASTERVRVTSAGLVGIGTSAPYSLLDLHTSLSGQKLSLYADSVYRVGMGVLANEFRQYTHQGGFISWGHLSTSDQSTFTERTRLDSSGRLLVGTSTSIDTNALIQAYKSSGSVQNTIKSDSLANDNDVSFIARGGSRSGYLGVFKHSGIADPSPFVDLAKSSDGGSVYYWSDSSANLRISTNVTNIGTTGGTVVGTQTSDERIKNILGPVEYGLDTIKQIEPVRFALKSEPDTERLGFIAQQVKPLVPQSVFDTKEHIEGEPEDAPTKLGMEYVSLIPVLVNAIKELSAEVDALKAKLS